MTGWFSAHTHSKYSAKDALPSVEAIVAKAKALEYPALGLTDHGTMAGSVQLYKECRKAGIKPMPGMEAYVTFDRTMTRNSTQHMGLLATSQVGYRNLVGLTTHAHKMFYRKPLLGLDDLARFAEDGMLDGIACLSGCWFGLVPTLLREGDARSVRNILTALDSWFGSGCYVEIQNHMIDERDQQEELFSNFLHAIAMSTGLPVVITQDSHYVEHEDRKAHETLKTLMSWSDDPDDAVFPGDGYHMVDEAWMDEHHNPDIFRSGMAGLADLAAKANVVIPELDKFSLKVPDITINGNPDDDLITRCGKALFKLSEDKVIPEKRLADYSARLDEELNVVIDAGFSGYLLFTANVTDWMRGKGIMYNVRGSASGSLICWLLEITSFDPVAWGLSFDRFLSRDRTKPPDIDIDVEHLRRDEVLEWLDNTFTTCRISTWMKLSANQDVDDDLDSSQSGSLLVRWKMRQRKLGLSPDGQVPDDQWLELMNLSDHEPLGGYGVHAAGVVVAPDEEAMTSIPLQWVASSKTLVTAYDKDDVEAMGMLKLDLLGLKTLTALKDMSVMTGITPEEILFNDRATLTAIGKGDTVGCFQLEGGAAQRGCRQLKPKKIDDVIAAMALFRPAPLKSGATDQYIARANKDEEVPVRHEILNRHTANSYGVLLYQEQVVGVMRDLGMGPEDLTKFLKAVKASNAGVGNAAQVIDGYHDQVAAMAKSKGMSIEDFTWLWQQTVAFAGYSFNLAHSTSYGVMAYITAWYKTHHPVAFWTGMLNAYIGDPQEEKYLKAIRSAGITLRGPNVNRSEMNYSADPRVLAIRKGLMSIKGVGPKAAADLAANKPYTSIADLAERVNARAVTGAKQLRGFHTPAACGGVIKALWEAGALEGLPEITTDSVRSTT